MASAYSPNNHYDSKALYCIKLFCIHAVVIQVNLLSFLPHKIIFDQDYNAYLHLHIHSSSLPFFFAITRFCFFSILSPKLQILAYQKHDCGTLADFNACFRFLSLFLLSRQDNNLQFKPDNLHLSWLIFI